MKQEHEEDRNLKIRSSWVVIFIMLIGLILGTVIGSYCGSISALSWLNYGQVFGLTSPLVLDLGALVLTLGLTIKINIASVLGIVLAFLCYKLLVR
ncbi:DUF4321 domain-containing protein [Petralouisia muris]|jgi:hypothetical protein|uniref:DUF4321 domain-containing protein n=1 Tax=Petralouisia muris TaxID=3032872 RepID=A0AC61RZE6_9FIRM|nr:DUF4321 domain-containing protein [Petralouisia muris]